jgi:hypothetical protein
MTMLDTNDQPPIKPQRILSISKLFSEPLMHFMLLGGLLFAADHYFISRQDDPRTIIIGSGVDSDAVELFQESRGREPNEKEMEALHRVWLDNEILYREGLAMQVDKGDDAIRERVIFKALSVIDASVKLPAVDDKQLDAWFEQRRDKYDEPARYDFQEAALAGDVAEADVRAFVKELNAGAPGDAKAGLRVFKGRPVANLVQSYGEDFAKGLADMPAGKWQAMQTRNGWRAIQLDAIHDAKPAVFEEVRNVVLQDWKDDMAAQQRTAAVRALAKKYTVKYEHVTGHSE